MTETSSLNRSWLFRMGFITIVFLAFGIWGAWDATTAYPARGLRHAEFLEKEYLAAADERGRILGASVPSPVVVFAEIKGRGAADPVEAARFQWLNALRVIGKLDAEHTTIDNPSQRLEDLKASWGTRNPPKPLSELDIPTQYLIMTACSVIGVLIVCVILKASRSRYTFDPATNTLTLPGNHSVTPADLADIDKRKWHKFIVFLKLKPSHPTLGGKEVRIDLLRHAKVEGWVLAMEAAAFPELAKPAPTTDAPGSDKEAGSTGIAGEPSQGQPT